MEERAGDKKIFQQNNFPIYCLEFLFSMFSLGRKVLLKEKIREQSTNDFMPTDLFIHTFSCKMTKSSSQFQIQEITLHLNACIYPFHCVRCLERFWKTKVLLYIKPLHQNWTWRNTLLWHSNYLAVVRRSLLYLVNNFILEDVKKWLYNVFWPISLQHNELFLIICSKKKGIPYFENLMYKTPDFKSLLYTWNCLVIRCSFRANFLADMFSAWVKLEIPQWGYLILIFC